MRCVIIGASGQVGGQLALSCAAERFPWVGTTFQHPRPGLYRVDLRDSAVIESLVRDYRPDIVFLSAAMTHVDRAEQHPGDCRAVNVGGAETVARALRQIGGVLVFFSTEHVFPATTLPCCEDDPLAPVSVYAQTKAEAEKRIRDILPDSHLILRTSWVFGPEEQGKNFVYRAVRTLRAGQPLVVPEDQYGQPTYSPDLARTAIGLCREALRGTYHVVGPAHLTRLEFARLIAEVFVLDTRGIVGRPTADLGQAAPRPLRVCLSDERIRAALGRPPIRHPRDALQSMRVLFPVEQHAIPVVA